MVATFRNISRDLYVPNPQIMYTFYGTLSHGDIIEVYILSVVSKRSPILGLINIWLSDAAHRNIMKNVPCF